MSKILVTGGAGFIGSTLVDSLINLGHDVTIIDDLSSGRRDYVNEKAHFFSLDICSLEIENVFKNGNFDFVYHLAAQIDVRHSVSDPEFDNRINVLGGLNVLENCRKYKIKKIIMASTGGAIYGEAEEIPTTENSPTYPLSPYGIHKLTLEKYLNYYYQVYGLNYTVLRFANVYGPRQFKGGEAGVIAIFIDNAIKNISSRQFGDGKQTRDFVYVDDVARALVLAMEIDCTSEINISSGKESSLLDVRREISKSLGREIEIIEEEGKEGEQRRSCLSYARAQAVLNWIPEIELAEGIKRTIVWTQSLENN